jgi:hypothetical protein
LLLRLYMHVNGVSARKVVSGRGEGR